MRLSFSRLAYDEINNAALWFNILVSEAYSRLLLLLVVAIVFHNIQRINWFLVTLLNRSASLCVFGFGKLRRQISTLCVHDQFRMSELYLSHVQVPVNKFVN
jgi:hypothetical protein